MFKRMLMGAGLSLAMLGGVAAATHSSGTVSAHPAAAHAAQTVAAAEVKATEAEVQSADAASTTPCTTDAAGNESGNCQDSQNASGGADVAGPGEGEGVTAETDTVQSGAQTQSGSQAGGN
ncbi:MAG TPA: hypothetical protein VNL71_11670 [Chloroflexota bacterium]|nr:hypothetical protein [Chloroflexota bacterium]